MMEIPDKVREERKIPLHNGFKNAIATTAKKVDCSEQLLFNNRQPYRSSTDYCWQPQTTSSNIAQLSPSQVVYARQRHPSGRPVADRYVPRELRELGADRFNNDYHDQKGLLPPPIPAERRRLPPRGMANPAIAGFIEGLRELARDQKQRQTNFPSAINAATIDDDDDGDENNGDKGMGQHRCRLLHTSPSRHFRSRKTREKHLRVLNREDFFFQDDKTEEEEEEQRWAADSEEVSEAEDDDEDADSGVGHGSFSSSSSAASPEELIFDIEL